MKRICALLLTVTAILFATSSLFAGETGVSGTVFANWRLHLNSQNDPQERGKNYNAFNVDRAYIIVDHKFSDKYSANIIGEAFRPATGEGGLQYRVRSAYMQINKLVPYVDVRFGMQGLLWFDMVEKAWKLRYIDNVSLDKLGLTQRADLGATLIGNCPGGYGILALQVVNGGGYLESEMNKYKDYVTFLQFTPFPKNADFGECAFLGQWYKGWPNIVNNATGKQSFHKNTKKDRLQAGLLFKYRKWLTAYSEYFQIKDDFDFTNSTEKQFVDKDDGFELFGRMNVATSESFLSRVYLFGKFEYIDKHKNQTDAFLKEEGDARYLTTGVGYELIEGFEIAITFQRSTEKTNPRNVEIVEDERNNLLLNMVANFK